MINDIVRKVKNEDIDLVSFYEIVQKKVKENKSAFHHFNALADPDVSALQRKVVKEKATGALFGLPVSVKDNICVKGVETTAGSAVLKGYTPVFNATVVDHLQKEGAVVIGKTAQDEFGFGTFSTNVGVGFSTPKNPNDTNRVCGGSSGGSAGAVKQLDFPHISLGQSTGGSITAPAAYCGVVGLCPTYGRVSRYGLIDYGNSLDKIGPITNSVHDAALVLDLISGEDRNDSTTVQPKEPVFPYLDKDPSELKVAVISETFGEGIVPEIRKEVEQAIDRLTLSVDRVSLPLTTKYGLPAYYITAMAEASTTLAKYCGLRYGAAKPLEGNYNEYFSAVRTQFLGAEAKRRIMLGTFTRMAGYCDAYYLKALRVRTKIIQEYKKLFKTYDVLLSPSMPNIAPTFSEAEKLTPLEMYMMDILTVGPNFAGLPHLSVPCGAVKGMPVGLLAIGDHFQEGKIVQLAKEVKA